jgi:hypothetical protein
MSYFIFYHLFYIKFIYRMQKFDVGLEKIKKRSISFRKWSHISLNLLW